MKIIEIEPNTQVWLDWRNGGYSASEAPAIMADSKFFPKTPYQLYLVHTGQKEVVYNKAMQDGHRFESQIVDWASQQLNLEFKPVCVEKGEYLASLDGYCEKHGKRHVLEVKTTTHNSAIWNNGEKIYRWQLTHQALVCGVDQVHFAVYAKDSDSYKLALVDISDKDKQDLIVNWEKFGEAMRNLTPPELIAGKDYVIDESKRFKEAAERYKMLCESKRQIEKEIAEVKTELMKIADGEHVKGAGLSIYEVIRKGVIDYSQVKELENVDLEQYRKPASSYWVIRGE